MRKAIAASLLLMSVSSLAQAAPNCTGLSSEKSVLTRTTIVSPVADELFGIVTQLGAPSGVLASAYEEAESVDRVLLRQRVEACKQVATALPAPGAPNPNDPAGYKPKTQYDNTPYRFNMTQNGKRMTADDFDAWLKATGYSAGRRADSSAPAVAAPAADPQPANAAAPSKTP